MAVLINQIAFIYIVSAIPFILSLGIFELTLAANFVWLLATVLFNFIIGVQGYLTVAS